MELILPSRSKRRYSRQSKQPTQGHRGMKKILESRKHVSLVLLTYHQFTTAPTLRLRHVLKFKISIVTNRFLSHKIVKKLKYHI